MRSRRRKKEKGMNIVSYKQKRTQKWAHTHKLNKHTHTIPAPTPHNLPNTHTAIRQHTPYALRTHAHALRTHATHTHTPPPTHTHTHPHTHHTHHTHNTHTTHTHTDQPDVQLVPFQASAKAQTRAESCHSF